MPLLAVEGAKIRCSHSLGYAKPRSSRGFLRIAGQPVFVAGDMPANFITLCPNYGPTTKPCTGTLPLANGISRFVFANDAPVVLEGATGPTDGIPPGLTTYSIRAAGQSFVQAAG